MNGNDSIELLERKVYSGISKADNQWIDCRFGICIP